MYYKRFYLSCVYSSLASARDGRKGCAVNAQCAVRGRRNCFADFDPALVATAALYLACKVEECVEKVVRVITKVRHAQPGPWRGRSQGLQLPPTLTFLPPLPRFPAAATVYSRRRVFPAALVLRCEGAILNVLRFDLVVHHPYRPLQQFAEDSGAPDAVFKMAWKIVNDSFCTLAPLVFPPFMVALGALTLAAAHCQWDASRWLAGLNVNPQELADVRGVLYAYYVAILDTKRRVAAQTQQAQDAGPGSSDGQAAAASLRDGASGAEMLGPADTLRGHGVDHDDDVARSFGIRDRQDTKTLQEIFARLESLVPPL